MAQREIGLATGEPPATRRENPDQQAGVILDCA
jgi:flagellar biosynthesis/type III secretory pathway ATPase